MEFPYHLIERIVVFFFDRVNGVLVDSCVPFIYIPETWAPDAGIDMVIMYKAQDESENLNISQKICALL